MVLTNFPKPFPSIVAREAEMTELEEKLARFPTAFVLGPEGSDRSRFALEFAFRQFAKGDAHLIWRIRADSEDHIKQDVQALLYKLGEKNDGPDLPSAFREAINNTDWSPWVLIFDDVADHKVARNYFPDIGGYTIIATSKPPADDGSYNEISVRLRPLDPRQHLGSGNPSGKPQTEHEVPMQAETLPTTHWDKLAQELKKIAR
jgi:hypothetical protein